LVNDVPMTFIARKDLSPNTLEELIAYVKANMEEYLRHVLIISRGDPMVFLTRPITASMLALAVIAMIIVLKPAVRKKRVEAFQED
jgi:TctA family transporter